ncbi:hypothetical protein LC612_42330, partial [Nostoc sp. CHAB 5834]|nr:hypothetical protein [Nostoc sp. CHAB 5834]
LMVIPKECSFDKLERCAYNSDEYSPKGALRWSEVTARFSEPDMQTDFAVEKVYQIAGRVDRYGLPDAVNPHAVISWCEYMGLGYVASDAAPLGHLIETDFCDSGDDGNREPWMQVRVIPSTAKRLLAAMAYVKPYVEKIYTAEFGNVSMMTADTPEGLESILQDELANGRTPTAVFIEDQHGDKLEDLKITVLDGTVHLSSVC